MSTGELTTDTELIGLVGAVSRTVGRRFSEFVSKDDLAQEIWVWVLTHTEKIEEWNSLEEVGYHKLKRALYHVANGYAQEQKSQKLGYRSDDLFYYRLDTFRYCLPILFLNGFDLESPAYADFPDRSVWLDLVNAVQSLSEEDYRLIYRVFDGDPERDTVYSEIAAETESTPAAVRSRVNRILGKMQRHLGGPEPDPTGEIAARRKRRKVRTNAQAIAEVRMQYDD